ncbi:SpoIIIAH-like family protein [Agathobaculum sp. Marseille-P7918]|uniref:SpoIIIAH-like family protein n=1 Tax=Agathobaculum sp. Marseille-P7918 TaxID=2479843 RepID=UPI003565B1DF
MKKIKKRGAVYGVIALLLCAAVYLNWSYVDAPEELLVAGQTGADTTGADTDTAAGAEGEDYFATSRLTREQARDEAVSTLRELSESEDADQAAKDEAAAQISALADDSVAEANIESLIRAKGYADAVVMIGDSSVNVVVAPPDGGLQATDVTVIKDIVVSETGMTAGQVKIVEAE